MEKITTAIADGYIWIKEDWRSHPVRLIAESVAWILNLTVAVIFTLTVPNPPMLIVYPIFLVGLIISMWSAVSRGSFGMLMTNVTIFIIDIIGYIKLL
jgi:hypothetical protein